MNGAIFTITEQDYFTSEKTLEVQVRQGVQGQVYISIPGYGEQEADDGLGVPIIIEMYGGKLRVVTFPDINSAEAKVIDMEGARESLRLPDVSLDGVEFIGGIALATREQVEHMRRLDAIANPETADKPYDDKTEIRDWNIINEGEGIILESHEGKELAKKRLKDLRNS